MFGRTQVLNVLQADEIQGTPQNESFNLLLRTSTVGFG